MQHRFSGEPYGICMALVSRLTCFTLAVILTERHQSHTVHSCEEAVCCPVLAIDVALQSCTEAEAYKTT